MSATRGITATEQIAIDTAHAAVDADRHLHSAVDTVVFALSRAGLLASPEQSLHDHMAGLTRAVAHVRARSREVWTPVDLVALLDELLAGADTVTVYRAECHSMPLGWYLTAAAAKSHCQDRVRCEDPSARTAWVPDDDTADSPAELWTWSPDVDAARDPGQFTGYAVIPVTAAALYDPDAEE